MKLRRWAPHDNGSMWPDHNGEWVVHEDAAEAIAAERAGYRMHLLVAGLPISEKVSTAIRLERLGQALALAGVLTATALDPALDAPEVEQ